MNTGHFYSKKWVILFEWFFQKLILGICKISWRIYETWRRIYKMCFDIFDQRNHNVWLYWWPSSQKTSNSDKIFLTFVQNLLRFLQMVYMIIFMKTRRIFWSRPPIMRMIHLETVLFLAMPIVYKVFCQFLVSWFFDYFKIKHLWFEYWEQRTTKALFIFWKIF